jgi:hypothetical protein
MPTIITPKHYELELGINIKTARIYYKDDCLLLGRNILTDVHFNYLYGGFSVIPLTIIPKYNKTTKNQIKPQKTTKENQLTPPIPPLQPKAKAKNKNIKK